MHFPSRFVHLEAARERFGDELVERFGDALMRGDASGDRLAHALNELPPGRGARSFKQALEHGIEGVRRPPAALRRFFREVEAIPPWVDWEKVDRGGRLMLRAGPIGCIALGCQALPLAYASPAGNKPLALSERLIRRALRRLSETAAYIVAVCRPGGLRPGAPGFKTSVRVRMMHAQVRRLALASGSWRTEAWGMPINQSDQSITNILFSVLLIDAMRALGLAISDADADALVHTWRYAGHLMGVAPEMCVASTDEGARVAQLVFATQAAPDDDSRALVHALLRAPEQLIRNPTLARLVVRLNYRLSRRLIGDALADKLGYPKGQNPLLFGLGRALTYISSATVWPLAQQMALRFGYTAWGAFIAGGLGGHKATFRMPLALKAEHAP